ncbi:MAG: hypothetical protein PQJ61_01420 [Spirochaetales bacterium]|uniref:Autotransporter domain-containing protein n=1 Tax=Candidatus Thalassospirochaeta sargassi TaxID=3119039 RepID=A0AAJ1IA54_9SPIO|nr:hypothetical protein [Spirochaetales bacterium]
MKKSLSLISIILLCTSALFAQESITPEGSNTFQSSNGTVRNAYDYLLDPAYVDMMEGETLFFALDNSGDQFGTDYFNGFRAGWAVDENLGFIINYRTDSYMIDKNLGDGTDSTENITYDYTGYDQATGQYTTITETVNDELEDNNIEHSLFFHTIYNLGDGMGIAVQTLADVDFYNYKNLAYTDTYSNTASPTDATLTTRGDQTETIDSLLDNDRNIIALDVEFGMDSDDFLTRVVLGLEANNIRFSSSAHTVTVTDFNDGAGVDNTIRDDETITSYTGQYYTTDGTSANASFGMNSSTPLYLSTIGAGIGSDTEIPMDGFTLVIPGDIGFDFPMGKLQTVASTTTVTYDDADADNIETSRSVDTDTTTLDMGLDMYARTGAGIKKIFTPAENVIVTAIPGLYASVDVYNDTRTRTTTALTQVDGDGDGAYTTVSSDTDTEYTQSGYEYKTSRLTTNISFQLPVGLEWKANELMSFRAGYDMSLTVSMVGLSTLQTGNSAYTYEQYTDNLDSANSYDLRRIDGSNDDSIATTTFTTDFGFSATGMFGASLDISENFTVDLMATGSTVEIDAFTVMGIMKY